MNGIKIMKTQGLTFYTWNIFAAHESSMQAVLTTRSGDTGENDVSSLNLGLFSGGAEDAVRKNFSRISGALGLPSDSWALLRQIHGITVLEACSRGVMGEADALLVTKPGISAAVVLADCHPIVLYDPTLHIGAVCHAGWRGTAAGIAEQAVLEMVKQGSRTEDILAAAGPGIGECCFEVENEVVDAMRSSFSYPEDVFKTEGVKPHINLEKGNRARLTAAGIPARNIGISGMCTSCRTSEFFSYRKEKGRTGRYAAVLTLF